MIKRKNKKSGNMNFKEYSRSLRKWFGGKGIMIYKNHIKRSLDFLVGVLILVLLWWLMIIVAIIILCTDGRPVLFKQERIGQFGKPFSIYKFRTMVRNAESIGARSTSQNDPRITSIGRFLRKTSLDELPQVFNLIKGDMSVVGYRPGVFENYEDSDFKSGMFNVKPGITGYAQVNGRSSLSLEDKRAWEMKYVNDISFFTDIKILFKTVAVVLKRSNSY